MENGYGSFWRRMNTLQKQIPLKNKLQLAIVHCSGWALMGTVTVT